MFYLPWCFRDQTEFLTPKGPNFSWARKKKFRINGTEISLVIPSNKTQAPIETVNPKSNYDLEELQTKLYGVVGNEWRSLNLIKRYWSFYGPWLTGKMGSVDMYAGIYSPKPAADALNFFHPRALENGIANFLTLKYGDQFPGNRDQQSWLTPLNWRQKNDVPCAVARFDAEIDRNVYNDGIDSYLIFPVGKKHLFIAYCSIRRSAVFTDKKPLPKVDEWIDVKPFRELTNQVLDSIQIKLSPQAESDQKEALNGLEDKNLIKEFPPLKWTKPQKNK
jgi:hypothetical protein